MKNLVLTIGLPLLLLTSGGAAAYWTWLHSASTYATSGLVQAQEIKNASQIAGRVASVLVSEGQHVHANDVLLRFDDGELQAKIQEAQASLLQAKIRYSDMKQGPDPDDIRQAKAQVNQTTENYRLVKAGADPGQLMEAHAQQQQAEIQLKVAQQQWRQAQAQVEQGIYAPAKLDIQQAQVQSAQASVTSASANYAMLKRQPRPEQLIIARSQRQVAQAQLDKLLHSVKPGDLAIAKASVDQADSNLKALIWHARELTVRAPIEGVISVLSVNPGELVQPGRAVITLVNDDQLWTDIYVPEKYLNQVQLNQMVHIRSRAFPRAGYTGKVVFISPKSEFIPSASGGTDTEEGASFRVKVVINHLPANQRLLPGMKVHVEL